MATDQPALAQGPLEVDGVITDTDSAYGDELSTYTASLASSAKNFLEENGRRYHSFREGRYMLPNDEQENERLDIHHALMLHVMKSKLFWAPIGDSPQRILDLGTGTGIWAIDVADEYPSAEVIGNDFSPIQPTLVPPNLRFFVDDFEDEWAYPQPFDFIHARYLATAVRDWPRLVKQAFNYTKPGGWTEFQDWDTRLYSTDDSYHKDLTLHKWHEIVTRRRTSGGYEMFPGPKLEKWVREAGFINVEAHKLFIPLGLWPKDKDFKQIGAYNLIQLEAAVEAITLGSLTTRTDNPDDKPWTRNEVEVILAKLRPELRDPKIHGQYDFFVVFGQKPGAGD